MTDTVLTKSILENVWKILIIDDDEDDFIIARSMLKEARGQRFDVHWSSTYTDGQKELNNNQYTAVLVDYDLGQTSGIELIREATQRGNTAPLILFTGRGSYEVDVEAMQAGATLYLSKSEANSLLLERSIRYAVELKQKENELRLSKERLSNELSERQRIEEELRKSETKLRESGEQLRDVLESTHDIIFILDPDWRLRYINRTNIASVGAADDALVGKSFWEIFPFYHSSIVEQNFRIAMEGRNPVHFELRGANSPTWYDVSVYPVQEGISVFAVDRSAEKKAQEELQTAYSRLRFFVDANIVGVVLAREDGPLIECNDYFLNLLGYSREDFTAGLLNWRDLTLAMYLPFDEQAIAELKGRGTAPPYEKEYRRKDGSHVWININRALLPDGTIAAFVLDITEHKQAELALQESQRLLEQAQEIARLGSWEFNLARNQLTWSDEVYRIFGLQPRSFRVTYAAFLDLVHPDDRAAVDEAYKGSLRDSRESYEIEHRVIHKQTGEIRYVHEKCEHIRDASGRTIRSVGMVHDITEHKKVEQDLRFSELALKRSLERERARSVEMETLMDTVPAMIWIARDPECREMTGNRYGYEFLKMWQGANISKTAVEEELNRQPYRNFKDGREIPTEELPMQVAAATGKPAVNFDFDLVFNDGTVRTVLGNVNPLFDENGQPGGSVAVFMDITDRQQVEEQLKHYAQELERSNQALEDFAFVASHDLQEPLRKIILFGNNLRQRLQSQKGEAGLDETASEYLDRMQNAAGRMQAMIKGLLELSRVNTHGARFTPVNLNQVMADVISDLEVQIQSAGGQVEIEDLPTVEADAFQMRQLFQNLIGNAIKFHKPDVPPVVHVSAVESDQKTKPPMIAIQVEDNGIGFEQQFAAQIFLPFQRLRGRHEYEGTGLGLAICQKIVERHNGMIEVQSVPEQGTKFMVHLPSKIM